MVRVTELESGKLVVDVTNMKSFPAAVELNVYVFPVADQFVPLFMPESLLDELVIGQLLST